MVDESTAEALARLEKRIESLERFIGKIEKAVDDTVPYDDFHDFEASVDEKVGRLGREAASTNEKLEALKQDAEASDALLDAFEAAMNELILDVNELTANVKKLEEGQDDEEQSRRLDGHVRGAQQEH